MPEHRAEALRPHRLHPRNECVIRRAFAGPMAVRELLHTTHQRRRIRKRRAFRQPLAHTRRTDPTRKDTHGHVLLCRDCIRIRRHETTTTTARARLRIIRDTPRFSVKRCHAPGLRRLLLLAMIRRVRLPRDHKHLANAHMRHAAERELFSAMHDLHFHFQPATCGSFV